MERDALIEFHTKEILNTKFELQDFINMLNLLLHNFTFTIG